MNTLKKEKSKNNIEEIILLSTLIFSFLFLTFYSMTRLFDSDEFEHIHSSWMVYQGKIPYIDFFEHHNPLMWYCFSFIIIIFGETINTIFIARLFILFCEFGIFALVYLICKNMGVKRKYCIIGILLLIFSYTYLVKSVEFRPDVVQTLTSLFSLYFIFKFIDSKKISNIIYAGLFLSISFLFLQKALFFILGIIFSLFYLFLKGKIYLKEIIIFGIFLLIPIALFLFYFFLNGALDDYFFLNFTLNSNYLNIVSFFSNIKYFLFDWIVFFIGTISIFYFLKKKDVVKNILLSICIFSMFFSLFFVKVVYTQYFMTIIPILIISEVSFMQKFDILKSKKLLLLFLGILIIPTLIIVCLRFENSLNTLIHQISISKFVLENTKSGDFVYDGDIQFNLFRNDLDFFWFSFNNDSAFDTYIYLKGFYNYDLCNLIFEKKPKLISDFHLNMSECNISLNYMKTKYENIYLRID
jgi:hypothetical protein